MNSNTAVMWINVKVSTTNCNSFRTFSLFFSLLSMKFVCVLQSFEFIDSLGFCVHFICGDFFCLIFVAVVVFSLNFSHVSCRLFQRQQLYVESKYHYLSNVFRRFVSFFDSIECNRLRRCSGGQTCRNNRIKYSGFFFRVSFRVGELLLFNHLTWRNDIRKATDKERKKWDRALKEVRCALHVLCVSCCRPWLKSPFRMSQMNALECVFSFFASIQSSNSLLNPVEWTPFIEQFDLHLNLPFENNWHFFRPHYHHHVYDMNWCVHSTHHQHDKQR